MRKKEPKARVAARQRACRRRKLERIRQANLNFFLWQLQKFYRAEELSVDCWVPISEFFSNSLIKDFITSDEFTRSLSPSDKTIDFAIARIAGTTVFLIRPRWL
jgi:hypothetical protein